MAKKDYVESTVRVLKGLEPVKLRPGMYTLTDSPLHIIQEVVDNSVDEMLAGYGTKIAVTLHSDGSVSVEDDGRGIPVGMHPEEHRPVVELVFTQLHAGGKFDKKSGGAYSFSGGLHGVGVSVTNALSRRMEVTVWRDGKAHSIAFAGGDVAEPLVSAKSDRGRDATGTRVRAWPDAQYFDSLEIPAARLEALLRSKAVLLPGIEVTFANEKAGTTRSWKYQGGLREYFLSEMSGTLACEPFESKGYIAEGDENFSEGEGAAWVVAWAEEGTPVRESYVNLVPTPLGGTHEAGLRDGLFQSIRSFIEVHGLSAKGVKLITEDVAARAGFILSARLIDPQFQGQTKERLTSRDALKLVSGFVRAEFDFWLNSHVEEGRKIAELIIRTAQDRVRSSRKVVKKKGSSVAVLPGKLTDCESDDATRTELFLVEGDSAGGSAKAGRDKEFQAVLPLRGKVLNTWEVEPDRLFENNEIHDISVAIGVDPHKRGDDVDLSGLRYSKICIMSDADVDGSHIQVLLLTLFFRHFPKLIETGHIYIALPPLFRVDVAAAGKRPARRIYCLDERERDRALAKLENEGIASGKIEISRFKGLGEMSAEQLWETALSPDTRKLLPVLCPEEAVEQATTVMTRLMGVREAASRRILMEERANLADVDV